MNRPWHHPSHPQSRTLLIGAAGMLGRAWHRLLEIRGVAFDAVTRETLDIADRDAVERAVTDEYGVVINCAAWTDVDGAEEHETDATRINGEAVGHLATRCRQTGALLVHFSTDYVFNGRANAPYPVNAPIDPVNAYGRSKAAGESALLEQGDRYLNIRTSWLYAPWGNNFVNTISKLAEQRDSLRVVNDQRGRPTSCRHLASATLALIEKGATGFYHVTDGGECTWYQFAEEIVRNSGAMCRVEPCGSEEYPRPATRPTYSVLDLVETEALIGAMPHWKKNLRVAMGVGIAQHAA